MPLFKKSSLLIACFLLMAVAGFSQSKKRKLEYSGFFDSYYYRGPVNITIGGGLSVYSGDFAKGLISTTPGFNFNIGANYKIWPRIYLGAEFSYFTLAAKDYDSARGVVLNTANMEFDVYGRLYWLDDIVRRSPDRRKIRTIKSYFIAGAGIVKTPSTFIPAFPVGLGFSYTFSQRVSLLAEYTQHLIFSDNLDGYTGGTKKDGYGLLSFKLQYTPTAPRARKKAKNTPPEPNANREEHQEWRKKKEVPKPVEEEPLPDENPPKEENPEENPENTNGEEQPQENNTDTPPAEIK